jgi:hypothetical protein
MPRFALALIIAYCTLISAGGFPVSAAAPLIPQVSITESPYNADNTGTMDCAPIIEKIKNIQGNKGMLLVPRGTFKISADLIIPAGMSLKVADGGILAPSAGATLAINGNLIAGMGQIFAPAGSGKIALNNGSVKEIFPQWWGAKGDGVADDTSALRTMTGSLSSLNSLTINFGMRGQYYLSDTVDFGEVKGLNLVGAGFGWAGSPPNVKFIWRGGSGKPIFKFRDGTVNLNVENLGFDGGDEAIRITRVNTGKNIFTHHNYIRRCSFSGQSYASVVFGYRLTESYPPGNDDFDGMIVEDCNFSRANIGILANCKNNSYHLVIRRCWLGDMKQCIVTNNIFNVSLEDTYPLNSDHHHDKYAVEILSGGNALSFRNILSESPLLLKVADWGGDSARAAVLQNVSINSGNRHPNPAIELKCQAILFNVQVSTVGHVNRTIRLRNGLLVCPWYKANDTILDDTGNTIKIADNGNLVDSRDGGGEWTEVPYEAENFGASTGAWTVKPAEVLANQYKVLGRHTLFWNFYVDGGSVAGITPDCLKIKLPGGFLAQALTGGLSVYGNDNGTAAVFEACVARGEGWLKIYKLERTPWSPSNNKTGVRGTVIIPIK